jgi:hypothetical protein
MNIRVSYIGDVSGLVDYVYRAIDVAYQAIDADTYDGAPDGAVHPIGYGRTRIDAVRNLLDLIEEAGDE